MRRQDGFTIPELVVVMTLTLMLSGMIISFAFTYWGQATEIQTSSSELVDRQNIGDSLRNRLNHAGSLLNQNSLPDVNAGISDPTDISGTAWELRHAVPETITLPPEGQVASILYYESPAITQQKDTIMNGAQPFWDEFVLYLNSKKQLRLRTLANPLAPGNSKKTTCPDDQATSTCYKDAVLADDVSDVSLKYFSKSGNVINWHDVKDPETGASIGPDFADVEVVEITITFKKRNYIHTARDYVSKETVRVALRNG